MFCPVDFVLLGFSNKFDVREPRNCLQFCLTGGILDPFSMLCGVLSVNMWDSGTQSASVLKEHILLSIRFFSVFN